jgi:tetratricopeptide (TPR) repeat protein
MRGALAVAALALVLAGAGDALAASKQAQAKRAFRKAQRLFKDGQAQAALPHYQRAYELSNKRPSAVFGLAQCERSLDMYEESIAHFEEYLALRPRAKNAREVKKTIALLQAQLAARNAPPPEPPEAVAEAPPPPVAPPPPPPAPPPSIVREVAPPEKEEGDSFFANPILWIVVGAVVVAGAGVALGVGLSGERDPYGGNTDVVLSTLRDGR